MPLSLPQGCKPLPACLDYRAFVMTIPEIPESEQRDLNERLVALGRVRHEALGVAYVDAEWGFLVVPPAGYPELRVTFFRGTAQQVVEEVLCRIARILGAPCAAGAEQPDREPS